MRGTIAAIESRLVVVYARRHMLLMEAAQRGYMVTARPEYRVPYDQALKEAQAQGFAEANPTMDVSGRDSAQKLAILASLVVLAGCSSDPLVTSQTTAELVDVAKRTAEIVVDAASVPCLEDHLVRGTPTLPGAWALDLMLQAAMPVGVNWMIHDSAFHSAPTPRPMKTVLASAPPRSPATSTSAQAVPSG